MTRGYPRYDPHYRRVRLSAAIHPNTLAVLMQLKQERGLSLGLLIDDLVRTAQQPQEQRT
jgi:hypothetical protein